VRNPFSIFCFGGVQTYVVRSFRVRSCKTQALKFLGNSGVQGLAIIFVFISFVRVICRKTQALTFLGNSGVQGLTFDSRVHLFISCLYNFPCYFQI